MDLGSVRNAVEAIKKHFPDGIDVLCNNAGIMADEDRATKDGI
jgi:short-subunit dehydrogenase involved in D-alanine esterification of teichoic acids